MRRRIAAFVSTLTLSALAAGCGGEPPAPSAPSLATAQLATLPLEEAGALNLRQNLAEPWTRQALGDDPN